jgi:hypothetical protein
MDRSWGMDGDHTGENGKWVDGSKYNSQNVTYFYGICFGGLGFLGIKTCVGPPIET